VVGATALVDAEGPQTGNWPKTMTTVGRIRDCRSPPSNGQIRPLPTCAYLAAIVIRRKPRRIFWGLEMHRLWSRRLRLGRGGLTGRLEGFVLSRPFACIAGDSEGVRVFDDCETGPVTSVGTSCTSIHTFVISRSERLFWVNLASFQKFTGSCWSRHFHIPGMAARGPVVRSERL
jgi:hypothetical protein